MKVFKVAAPAWTLAVIVDPARPKLTPFAFEKTTVPEVIVLPLPSAMFGPVWFVVPPPPGAGPESETTIPLLFSVSEPDMFVPPNVVPTPAIFPAGWVCVVWAT